MMDSEQFGTIKADMPLEAMPAKGGCGDCSYEEIEKSVDYMLNFKDPGPTGG